MKTLCLLRHAKSSWKNPGLSDFDRPLNERGKENAPMMAMRLRDYAFFPELIVASPAKRAKKTALVFAESLGYSSDKIDFRQDIYDGGLDTLLKLVGSLDDRYSKVMLVGHNPYITLLADALGESMISHMPTCAMVAYEFATDSWQQVPEVKGSQLFYDYPKKVANG